MRAAIYARVSCADGRQDSDNQLIQLKDFAAKQGWEIVHTYIDHASGKGTNHREQFKNLFLDAQTGAFDVVLVWALDRLTREGIYKTFGYLTALSDANVQFCSMSEPQFSSVNNPCWDLLLSIAAWIAKQERQRIGDRTKAGIGRKRGFNLWDHQKEIAALKGKMSVREAAEKLKAKYSLTVDPRMTVHRIWKG